MAEDQGGLPQGAMPQDSMPQDDAALVEETLAAASPPIDEPAAPAPEAPAEDEPAAPQREAAAEPQPQGVPIGEYLREREERLKAEQLVNAFRAREQPAARPDPFIDPHGFVQAQLAARMDPVVQRLNALIAQSNKATAVSVHGAELIARVEAEFDKALPTLDPLERARVLGAPNPFLAAVDWLRQRELIAEVGGDVANYRDRILAEALNDPEFLGRATEAARSFAAGQARPRQRASTSERTLPSVNRSGSALAAAPRTREPTDLELAQEALASR